MTLLLTPTEKIEFPNITSPHVFVCYAPVFCLLCGRIKGQLLLLPLSLLLKDRVLIILSFSWIDFSLLLSLNINVQNYGQFFFSIYYLLFFKFIRLFLMLILIYNKPSSIPFMLLIIPPIPISLISFMTNDSKNCEYWFFFYFLLILSDSCPTSPMKQYQEHHWSLSCPIQWLLFSLHGYLAKLITPLLNMFQTFSNTLLFSLPLLWPRCLGFFYWLSPYLNNNQTLKSVPNSVFGPLLFVFILSHILAGL